MPIIAVGDFNEILYSRLDRFPVRSLSESMVKSRLCQFLDEVGLLDLWRVRNPGVLQYSCYSASYAALSRIDLVLGNDRALQITEKIIYWPRGISDHSPVVLILNLGGNKPPKEWKITLYWFELIKNPDGVLPKMREFIEINEETVPPAVMWDALKAFLRGVLLQQMATFNKETRSGEEKILREVLEAENNYTEDPTPERETSAS